MARRAASGKYLVPLAAQDDAVAGAETKPAARLSPTAGKPRSSSEVVAQLSAKLAKQRKMLDELAAQKAANKSTWKWWQVPSLVILNNLLAVGFGWGAGSMFFGVGRWKEGWTGNDVTADGLIVSFDGRTTVMLERSGGPGHLVLEGGETAPVQLRFVDSGGGNERFLMETSDSDAFTISIAGDERVRIQSNVSEDGQGFETEILLNTPGALVVGGELSVDSDSLSTRSSSLVLSGARDIILDPAKSYLNHQHPVEIGNVSVASSLAVTARLSVCDDLLVLDTTHDTVRVGTATRPVNLSVHGRASGDAIFEVESRFVLREGNARFGNVPITTRGDFIASGSSIVLSSADDARLSVSGDVNIINAESGQSTIGIRADTGDIELAGTLIIEGNSHLMGDTILGARSTDTVVFDAMTTNLLSLHATGGVTLGDDDDDTVTVYGRFVVSNDGGKEVFHVLPLSGDTKVEGSLEVTDDSKFEGSAQIGAPGETIDVYGAGTFFENVTAHKTVHVVEDTVLSTVYASNLSLSGNLQLENEAGETTFRVEPSTGNTHSEGSLYISGDASFLQNTVLGSNASDVIEFKGTVEHFAKPLHVDTDARLERDVRMEQTADVHSNAYFSGNLLVHRDATVGDCLIQGDVMLYSGPNMVFHVRSDSGDAMTEGSIRVEGGAYVGSDVHIDSTADIYGNAIVHAGLTVSEYMSIGGTLALGGDVEIGHRLFVEESLKVRGDAWLGDTGLDATSVRGTFTLLDDDASIVFSAQPTGDMFVRGGVSVSGPVTLAGSTVLGGSGGSITVHATSLFRANMQMNRATFESALDVRSINVVCNGHLEAAGDTQIAPLTGQVALQASSDLYVTNSFGTSVLTVSSATGDVEANGHTEVHGDIDLEGHITSPVLQVSDVSVDQISSRPGSRGVSIEGVQFSNGEIRWTKAHEIHSLDSRQSVSIDGVRFEDGQMQLEQSNGHSENTDILTLTNTARSLGAATALSFRQTFHRGAQSQASSDSTMLSSGMSDTVWNEDSQTHNSYMSFRTAVHGAMDERMRITPSGDVLLNSEQNRIAFRAHGGVDVSQDVVIANSAESSAITIQSHEDATLRLTAGGGAGSRVQLSSPYGNVCAGTNCLVLSSTFVISNVVSPPMVDADGDGDADTAPMLQVANDGSSMLELTDLGAHASLRLSGNYEIGTATSAKTHTFSVQSGAASEIYIDSASDAAVRIQSGEDKQAQVVLIDPAKDGEGSSFALINDGGENEHKRLLCADGDGNTMIRIDDKGATGDLLATGDGVVGSMHVHGDRALTVQSTNIAEIDVLAGPQSDALLKITSGPDREASLVLLDPAPLTEGSQFHIVKSGGTTGYPTMRITDGTYEMMSLVDKGDTGDLIVTGSGLIGGPSGGGENVLQIESATEALMIVHSTGGDAHCNLISGGNQNSRLVLTDSDEDLKTFQVFNEGYGEPTLTFCAMSPCETKLMQIVRKDPVMSEMPTGDFIVNGNALLGGADAVGTRTLRVLSGHAASLKVLSGSSAGAKVVVQSGPDMNSKLTLVDPASGDAGSVFEIVNRGAETTPTLEITDGDNTLLSVTDQGTTGNLQVTGSGLFGGSNVLEDRTLSVTSGMQASLDVISGASDDAAITVTAGVDKCARLSMSGTPLEANSNHFELVLDGSQNIIPTLTISDGTYDLITFADAGDGTGDITVSGDALFGPELLKNACIEKAPISVLADANACGAVVGTDLDTADACERVLTDDPDDGNAKACSYVSTLSGPRMLSVQSGEQSSVDIRSGDDNDALVKIVSGLNQDAQLVFKDAFSDAQFVLQNDGDESEPTFSILHGADPLITITDRRNESPGNLHLTGSATFGVHDPCGQLGRFDTCGSSCIPRAACHDRTFTVQSSGAASVSITSTGGDAGLKLASGNNGAAKFVLADVTTTSSGASGSFFEIYNDGFGDREQLSISDESDVLLNVVDQHDTALLEVSGSGRFGLPTNAGDQTISVSSGGTASSKLISGVDAEAHVTVSSGADANAVLSFSAHQAIDSKSDSAIHSIFEVGLSGDAILAESHYAALDISDGGTQPIIRVVDKGSDADLELAGSLECAGLVIGGDVSLGNDISDQLQIRGHLTADFVFDANRDGNRLTLAMTDPTENTQITFPDENGIVLTSVSALSRLTTVGNLEAGSIAEGFGTISVSSDIETVGTEGAATCTGVATDPVADPDCAGAFAVKSPDDSRSSCPEGCTYTAGTTLKITAAGKVTSITEFRAHADVYLGDSADDELVLNGVVTTFLHMGFEASELFGPPIDLGDGTTTQELRDKSRRITFLSDAEGSKSTSLSARFNPTTIDSPAGERLITIPEVPSGGTAHIVSSSFGRVQSGSSCSTPNCMPVVQGRNPGAGTLVMPNEVLMDVTAGYIEGPSGLAPGYEEQIGLINRLIKPEAVLVANIADYGGTRGLPYVSAVAVDPGGGRATIVVRNIATDPEEVVTVPYKVAFSIFN